MAETWSGIEAGLLRRLDDRQHQLDRLRPWPAAAAERLWQGLLPEWIAGSNGFDGNRLTLEETKTLLEEGAAFPGFTLREHLEVLNHRDAIALARRLAKDPAPLRARTVRLLHAQLMQDIADAAPGHYRRYALERERGAGGVADLMRLWEKWLAGAGRALHPLERAAVAHHDLLKIQPFLDGNGRTARLAMNLMLMRAGYLPAILRYESRHDYREAVFRADQGDYRPLVSLVLRAVERVQNIYLMAFAG